MNQFLTPLADALLAEAKKEVIAFDVPGHKGRLSFLADYFGKECLLLDKNSRKSIDYLCQPRGVIREAEMLAADAFGAENAYFMVGGTTASVQTMVMSACAPGEKIILPRNVHYSVINAVILAGAVPVYINPSVHPSIGISLGMRISDIKKCIRDNPDAKAILVNNPTYYGICTDIRKVVEIAHENGMLVLADEAHGTHFYFGEGLPAAAMHVGADMAAVSMHKTGGSLTQSSILLSGKNIDPEHVRNIIGLTMTTSASYLLLASLDLARSYLATEGRAKINKITEMAIKTRKKINAMGGYYAFGEEIIDKDQIFDFDLTKISVNTFTIGLAGIEVYTILRDKYNIQLEFGDMGNILALCAIGDTEDDHIKLADALYDLREKYAKKESSRFNYEYISPITVVSPRQAFYSKKKNVHISASDGMISADSVMCYPPGIPILAPGELITKEIIEHIVYAADKGCTVSGLMENGNINVLDN
ncbi:MAG: aminotransferase class I/II-fold pyridoxal phosphate-dependent enzyme [Clostridia bacterium]|nr:aminotransferase class I/II-fold pyridoxal phosphate-dependent enzyme [Clostridia bacterium]